MVFLVYRHRSTKPINDMTARRRKQPVIDPIIIGQGFIALGFDHLQVIHSTNKRRQQQQFATAQYGNPAAK